MDLVDEGGSSGLSPAFGPGGGGSVAIGWAGQAELGGRGHWRRSREEIMGMVGGCVVRKRWGGNVLIFQPVGVESGFSPELPGPKLAQRWGLSVPPADRHARRLLGKE